MLRGENRLYEEGLYEQRVKALLEIKGSERWILIWSRGSQTRVIWPPRGAFVNVWTLLVIITKEWYVCYWHLVCGGQGSCYTSPQWRIIQLQMPTVPKLKNFSLV